MKKRLLASFLVLGLVLTQAPALTVLADDMLSDEPLVTIETETPAEVSEGLPLEAPALPDEGIPESVTPDNIVEDTFLNESNDVPVPDTADYGDMPEAADQDESAVPEDSAPDDSTTPTLLAAPAVKATQKTIYLANVGVTPPQAGTHSTTVESCWTSTEGLSVQSATWKTYKGYSTDDPAEITFEAGKSYLVVIALSVADGYTLDKGESLSSLDIDGCDYNFGGSNSIDNATLDTIHVRSAERYGSESLYIWAWVTATAAPVQSNFGVLISDTDGKTDEGGIYATYINSSGGDPYQEASNFVANDGDSVRVTATAVRGYDFKGWYQGDPNKTDGKLYTGEPLTTERDYTFTAPLALQPQYICAVFEPNAVTLTIHVSSREGVDWKDPIVIEKVPKGWTYREALALIGQTPSSVHIEPGAGYSLYAAWQTKKPFSTYTTADAAFNDRFQGSEVLNEDTDAYIPFKMLPPVELTLTAPKCGESASSSAPQVSAPDGAKWNGGIEASWIQGESNPRAYTGSFTGDTDYYIYAIVQLPFGYYTTNAERPEVKVSGGDFVKDWMTGDRYGFFVKVKAEHDPADPVDENVVEPTCTQAGSHDEVVYCTGCKKELSRETIEDPALGHDWGEWEVITEATEETAGLERRTCSRCKETEERDIPIVAKYSVVSGDGSTYTIGSSDPLVFTFKRSVDDEATFKNFQRIEIDGKEVAPENYTAEKGSVIITLKPEFLATLETGTHTLTAFFEEGKSASATFTIKAKEAVTPSSDASKDAAPTGAVKTGDNAKPWLFIGLLSASLLCIVLTLLLYRRRNTDQ